MTIRSLFCWVPNALTLSRVVAAIMLPWCPEAWLFPLLIAAGFTDLVDGALARLLRLQPRYGQLLDPVADKCLMAAAVGVALNRQWLSWAEVAVLLARDFATVVLSLIAVGSGLHNWKRLTPRLLGKVTTAAQISAVGAVYWFRQPLPWFVAVAAAVSLASAADYAWWAWKAWRGDTTDTDSD